LILTAAKAARVAFHPCFKRSGLSSSRFIPVIPLGLATKAYTGIFEGWFHNYAGGIVYEIFWILLISLLFPQIQPVKIALGIFIATSVLEFLQLWQPAWLQTLRATFAGKTLLGGVFSWWDFPHYALGCGLAAWGLQAWRHRLLGK
jgi:hypothetical protein